MATSTAQAQKKRNSLRTVSLVAIFIAILVIPALLFHLGILRLSFKLAEEFDFSIMASPTSRTVAAGQTTNYLISVFLTSGSTQQVSLSLSGLLSSFGNYSFSSQIGNPNFTSTLTINTIGNASTETIDLMITGSGGGKARSTNVSLTVTRVNAVNIITGSSAPVVSKSIAPIGGVIEVTNSSSPLYGLKIDVPEAASNEEIHFNVSYADVSSFSGLPENTSIVSKMITIQTTGSTLWNKYKVFDKVIEVTLPYDPNLVADDEQVRFYWYDEGNNKLDSTGFLYQNKTRHTITFYAGSFSKFVAIEILIDYISEILGMDFVVDTGFRPAIDGWFITNYGSYLASGGICLGMTSFAKWYFTYEKLAAGVGLYHKYIEGDPDEWRDDATAIQLATRAHLGTQGIWSSLTQEERNWAVANSKEVALSWIHGMIVSKEPQLVGLKTRYVDCSWAAGGHAVLTYRYSNGRFDIYDPNFPGTAPGTAMRQIPFTLTTGFTEIYVSGLTAASGLQFNVFYHASSEIFSSPNAYKGIYDSAEKKFSDDTLFPTIKLTSASTTPVGTTPEDTDVDGTRDTTESKAVISGTITGGQRPISSTLIFVSNQKFTVAVVAGTFSQEVPLYQGVNDLIILATDESTFSDWAGFLRDKIKSTASLASLTITLTWSQDNSDVDLHVLEPTIEGVEGRHIYYGDRGDSYDNPYLDMDNTWGYGPEHYYATEDMTLPNYPGPGKSLYGTYQVRVHHYADKDSDENNTQSITWHLHVRYLAFKDESTGREFWVEDSRSGVLTVESTEGTSDFYNSGPSWSEIWTIEYKKPNPDDFGIPPPPQNQLP